MISSVVATFVAVVVTVEAQAPEDIAEVPSVEVPFAIVVVEAGRAVQLLLPEDKPVENCVVPLQRAG